MNTAKGFPTTPLTLRLGERGPSLATCYANGDPQSQNYTSPTQAAERLLRAMSRKEA